MTITATSLPVSGPLAPAAGERVRERGRAVQFALFIATAICMIVGRLSASVAAERDTLIGAPVKLIVQPESIALDGPRDVQQLVITAQDAAGQVRDVTQFCAWSSDSAVSVSPSGYVTPANDGAGQITARLGELTVSVPITVQNSGAKTPHSFRREVMSVFNTSGCNAGSCHGIPSGRGGFRLSLWGFDPAADFLAVSHEERGRRANRLDPSASLILAKAQGLIPHQGGRRFAPNSAAAKILAAWIAEGLPDDPAGLPAVHSLTVLPGSRALPAPARYQQLAVIAKFGDNSERDVTRLTVFTSSEPAIAGVSPDGLVEFYRGGEVAVLCRYLDQVQTVRLTYLDVPPSFQWSNPPEANYVDQHVFAKLKLLGIAPSELCTDAEFIRRASLDITGTLPTPSEVRAFLASGETDKRARLVESLLARDDHVDFWTMKWGDVLRIKKTLIQPNGVKSYHAWLRAAIEQNRPFDEVVHELLTSQGHSYKNGPVNFYCVVREPKNAGDLIQHDLTETTASLFLGIRLQCAKCHNHPFERWTQDDYHGLAAFFTQVQQTRDGKHPGVGNPEHRPVFIGLNGGAPEIVQPRTNKVVPPKFLGGALPTFEIGEDRRGALAEWLTQAGNPFFAKSVVNRIWYHLAGRGIVDPVDDFRESNPAANDELLNALATDFTAQEFDIQHVIRTIANSRTYQLSAQTNEFNASDDKYFSHAIVKTLPAEVLLDAICAVTGVPETYENHPAGRRAIQLPDNDVIQQPSRYLGYDRHPFMKTFGQPARELACECARESEFSLAQALELMNGPTVAAKLSHGENHLSRLLAQQISDREILDELYLSALSRMPNDATAEAFLTYVSQAPNRRLAWEDVLWTILRSREFTSRH
jgi:hypothetical protein